MSEGSSDDEWKWGWNKKWVKGQNEGETRSKLCQSLGGIEEMSKV